MKSEMYELAAVCQAFYIIKLNAFFAIVTINVDHATRVSGRKENECSRVYFIYN